MIKRSFIYATLAASLLCGTINSPVQAIRWDQLTEAEQRVCRKIHEGSRRLDGALEAVTAASKALGAAGRTWNTKMPETVAAVRGLREMIGEYSEPKQRLPHFTPQGIKLIENFWSTLGKMDALFTATHLPVIGYPKLGLLAQSTASIQAAYHALVKGVPGLGGDRDPALLYGFLVEGYEADLPRDRLPVRGDALEAREAEFGAPAARAARPAAAAAAAERRPVDIGALWRLNPPLHEDMFGDPAQQNGGMLAYDPEEEDLRTPAARAAAATAGVRRPMQRLGAHTPPLAFNGRDRNLAALGEQDFDDYGEAAPRAARAPAAEGRHSPRLAAISVEDETYIDSILGDPAAMAAYFEATPEERTGIRAAKAREEDENAQAADRRKAREAAQRLRTANAIPGQPARVYTVDEQRQVAACIAAQKRTKGIGKSSGADMAAAVSRAMPDLSDREVDDLLFAQGIYPIRDAHEPATRLWAYLAEFGMHADEIYPIIAAQSVIEAERDLRYQYPHRANILACLRLLRTAPYQLNIPRIKKTIGVMIDIEEEEHDRY